MTYVLHRKMDHEYPTAIRGEGVYLIDSSGKRYLDGSCGASITCMGFDRPEIIAAIVKQLNSLPFAYTTGFTTEALEDLAEKIVLNSPDCIERAYFVSGGSEAVEAAIMLARQYAVEIGESDRIHLISRRNSYHGSTITTLAAGGALARRAPYEPLFPQFPQVAPCYEYRHKEEHETAEEYGVRAANELETEILRLGSESVFAFIAETVVGGNSGAVTPSPGYFKRIREICDCYGVLLILDEVMCGLGRTGEYFAFEHESVRPDIVTVAKGMAAGYLPIGGVLFSDRIYEAIRSGSRGFKHGHSFLGHATACAGALATQRLLLEGGVMQNIQEQSLVLDATLKSRFETHPHIGQIRGRGLFRGLELVEDRASKSPFDQRLALATKIGSAAMKRGLYIYTGSGCIDGVQGDFVLIAPPFVIETRDTQHLVSLLGEAIDDAIGSI